MLHHATGRGPGRAGPAPPGFTGNAPGGPSRWSTKRSTEWQPLKSRLVVEVEYDHFTGGRVAVHIITGGSDEELAKDGDHLTKDERYARTSEYLDIVRAEWTSEKPFDYKGEYYQVDQGFGAVKPLRTPQIPVYFGGSSDAAIPVAGKHADIFALWGETQAQVAETIARVRHAADSAKAWRRRSKRSIAVGGSTPIEMESECSVARATCQNPAGM